MNDQVARSLWDLRSINPPVRQKAIDALVRLGEPGCTPLAPALRDPDPGVKLAAALTTAVQSHASEVRTAAVRALGLLHDVRAVPALILALQDSDAPVRSGAAAALKELGDTEAVHGLIAVLGDPEEETGPLAAEALIAVARRDPTPGLRAALPVLRRIRRRDPIFLVARAAIEEATRTISDLPVSATPPPPDPATLPIPADAETDQDEPAVAPGFGQRLRRLFQKALPPQ